MADNLTTPAQREALQKACWQFYQGFLPMEQWEKGLHYVQWTPGQSPRIHSIDNGAVDVALAVEFATLTGTAPRGYVLVPVEVADQWLTAYTTNLEAKSMDSTCLLDAANDQLASALSPTSTGKE